jgi:hypothetical protein
MTRKDYILIAEALTRALVRARAIAHDEPETAPQHRAVGVFYAAEWLSEMLARDNPRFDRERFLKAAGVQS